MCRPGGTVRRWWSWLTHRLFPFDDPVARTTGLLVLALTVLAVVPVAHDLVEGRGATVGYHAASWLVMLAALVVARSRGVSSPRALLAMVALVDVAAVLFGAGSVVAGSDWGQLLPLVFAQVVVLCALSCPGRVLWAQVGFSIVASVAVIGCAGRAWRSPFLTIRLGIALLTITVCLVVVAWGVRALVAQLRSAAVEAERRSLTDPLTGALNRRGLADSVAELLAAARFHDEDVLVLVADLDHFKRVNDTHGHATGDAVLTATVRALRGVIRDDDLLARLGGEEFVVVARSNPAAGTTAGEVAGGPAATAASAAAWQLAERLRLATGRANAVLGVTVSIGALQHRPPPAGADPGDWLHQRIAEADELLYVAKREGRNRSVLGPPPVAEGSGATAHDVVHDLTAGPTAGPADLAANRGRPEPARRRRRGRRTVVGRLRRSWRRLDAVLVRVFPTESVVMRAAAALSLAMTPPVTAGFLLVALGRVGQLPYEIGWWVSQTAASVLVLWFRRELRRVFLAVVVLWETGTVLFGFTEAMEAPPNGAVFILVLHLLTVSFVAMTLSARALRVLICGITLATAVHFVLLTDDPPVQATVEVAAGTGLVLLVLIATGGATRLLLARLRGALAEAERRSDIDPLTGVANRRGLERQLAELVAVTAGRGDRLLAMIADLDHFKRVNDSHGHAAGDHVLRATAAALRDVAGDGIVARAGGEEFVVLVPVRDQAAATELAERLRWRVKTADTQPLVTISVGGSHREPPGPQDDPVAWLHRTIDDADDLLYRAKRAGRDRCVVAAAVPVGSSSSFRAGLPAASQPVARAAVGVITTPPASERGTS